MGITFRERISRRWGIGDLSVALGLRTRAQAIAADRSSSIEASQATRHALPQERGDRFAARSGLDRVRWPRVTAGSVSPRAHPGLARGEQAVRVRADARRPLVGLTPRPGAPHGRAQKRREPKRCAGLGFCAERDPGQRQPDGRRATPADTADKHKVDSDRYRDRADEGEPDVLCQARQIEPSDGDEDREGDPAQERETR
jgi:hypothetical protein